MPLDPQAKAMYEAQAAAGAAMPPIHEIPPAMLREGLRQQAAAAEAPPPEPVARIENRTIPGPDGNEIPVRIYWPEGNGPFGGIAYFHGGGWVICDLDSHDGVCRTLANKSGNVVMSVDYRLAPEAKYPAAADDCYAATEWLVTNGASIGVDPSRLAVAGDSAGGNLATVVAQMARDKGGPELKFQCLVYPVTNFAFDTPSYAEVGESDLPLTTDAMKYFWSHYLPNDAAGQEPYASPIKGDLAGLPPALVITAEMDPLRDEGEEYGAALKAAGVPTTVTRYDGMPHGFFTMGAILDKGRLATDEAGAALKGALS